MQEVTIAMPEGEARAFTFHPQGDGPWPGVLFFMDAPAIRPALFGMCERLASHGYFVLLPDMFWRLGPYPPRDMTNLPASVEERGKIFATMMASTNPEKSARDTGVFLDFLARQPQVRPGKVGVTGYCMGAGMSLRAAGNYPERVGAAAGFHGVGLATDGPNSPHLLAPKIKARLYFAGADHDDGFPPEMAERLRQALDAAAVQNEVTIYKDARHGYAPPDMPAYDKAAAERHWTELLRLFDETLKG
jgi:carboxymethylenebutenolidase